VSYPRPMTRAAVVVMWVVLLATPTLADTHYVSKTGSSTSIRHISLDSVYGQISGDTVAAGEVIVFRLRVTNVTVDTGVGGMRTGFRVYSPTGATWDTAYGAFTESVPDWMFEVDSVFSHSTDGSVVDTVGFWASANVFYCGLPPDFDDTALTIVIGPIDPSYHGHEICLDSVTNLPLGYWIWVMGSCDDYKGEV